MIAICPKCGGTAQLLQVRDDMQQVHDLDHPDQLVRIPVKVEEFRCQEQSCENEFEIIVREPPEGK